MDIDVWIGCSKCGRKVHLNELLGHAAGWIKDNVIPLLIPLIAPYIKAQIVEFFSTPTRGFLNESVSGFLRAIAFACPACEKVPDWRAIPNPEPEKPKEQASEQEQAKELVAEKKLVEASQSNKVQSVESM